MPKAAKTTCSRTAITRNAAKLRKEGHAPREAKALALKACGAKRMPRKRVARASSDCGCSG